jgi:hypothetical protein
VSIDRAAAWERAIILTPRPDVARALLESELARVAENDLIAKQGRVGKAEIERIQASAKNEVERRYWFPTRVRALGREVQFFVPTSFLGRPADASMGYSVFVTGAEIDQVGRSFAGGRDRPAMMVMPLVRGLRDNAFGIRSDDDAAAPPIIDVLAPTVEAQRAALQNFDVVAGRLATLPANVPNGAAAAPPRVAETNSPAGADRTAAVGSVPGSGATTSPAASATAPSARRTVPERLRELNQLRADGLISEQEYLELRRKILAEL